MPWRLLWLRYLPTPPPPRKKVARNRSLWRCTHHTYLGSEHRSNLVYDNTLSRIHSLLVSIVLRSSQLMRGLFQTQTPDCSARTPNTIYPRYLSNLGLRAIIYGQHLRSILFFSCMAKCHFGCTPNRLIPTRLIFPLVSQSSPCTFLNLDWSVASGGIMDGPDGQGI